jgi:hypothetical protein
MTKKATDRAARPPLNGRLTPQEAATRAPGAGPDAPLMSKVDRYGWKVADEPGKFEMVPKELLLVDHEYQRKDVRPERVRRIASNWSWWACGVLRVARRPDGKLYVYDGQHRKRAADTRADIKKLPCMIFNSSAADPQATEAAGFVRCNVERQRVAAYDLFVADLRRKDDTAVAVDAMVRETGYAVAKQTGPRQVTCINALLAKYQINAAVTRVVWNLCAEIANGEPVIDRLFKGLFRLQQHMQKERLSLDGEPYRSTLIDAGPEGLLSLMYRKALKVGNGHDVTCAQAVLDLLNKGRKRKIPDVVS